jgi:hypothetical protein
MRNKLLNEFVVGLVLCAALCIAARASIVPARYLEVPRAYSIVSRGPVVLAQNPSVPFTLPQTAEPTVSPINPGTLPGSTAAIGGSATGTNPITGLPCNGAGSLSVSGAGGLPDTATPPPGTSETIDQIPVGAPPTTSIFGSQSNLGSC